MDPAALGPDGLLDLLAREPKCLRRPIVTDEKTVVVGYDVAGLERLAAG